MDAMPVFDVKRPTTMAEAATLLATTGARIIAGGTDLVPNLRRGLERPVFITTHPLVPGVSSLEWVDSLTYYVYDDWASAPAFRRGTWPGNATRPVSAVIWKRSACASSCSRPNAAAPRWRRSAWTCHCN